jgi:hypothetical protein
MNYVSIRDDGAAKAELTALLILYTIRLYWEV